MPRVYLSPSLQEFNPFINGGSEEEIMNLIADAMEPYLIASGIDFIRNSPEMTLGEAIVQSNNSNVDFSSFSIFFIPYTFSYRLCLF
jgi:N-acetylmuramoyl-L-alanine amidase